MDSHSTTSSANEEGFLHADDTVVENLSVLQPGESPPQSVSVQTKGRSIGRTRGSSGRAPVPTTVEYADIPTTHIAIKADTPKKREESRKNDVLVEQQQGKATRVSSEARLEAISRRVHNVRAPPPPPVVFDEEPTDWVTIGVLAGVGVLVSLSVYFLVKNMTAPNVGLPPAPTSAAFPSV